MRRAEDRAWIRSLDGTQGTGAGGNGCVLGLIAIVLSWFFLALVVSTVLRIVELLR